MKGLRDGLLNFPFKLTFYFDGVWSVSGLGLQASSGWGEVNHLQPCKLAKTLSDQSWPTNQINLTEERSLKFYGNCFIPQVGFTDSLQCPIEEINWTVVALSWLLGDLISRHWMIQRITLTQITLTSLKMFQDLFSVKYIKSLLVYCFSRTSSPYLLGLPVNVIVLLFGFGRVIFLSL